MKRLRSYFLWNRSSWALKTFIGAITVTLWMVPAPATARQVLAVHISQATAHLTPLGAMKGSQQLQLAIGLPSRNPQGLTNLLRELYDPTNPNYHHFLTPEQFAARFGPDRRDYEAVIAFAKANGLKVTGTYRNRLLVDVRGSVKDIGRVLHVKMEVYQHPTQNRTFYAPDREPSVDLSVPILSISGLSDYSLPRPRLIQRLLLQGRVDTANLGSGPGGTYMGGDFRKAYVPDTTLTGAGQSVGCCSLTVIRQATSPITRRRPGCRTLL